MVEWRDVVGYEGLYQVSNMGDVRNTKTGRILKKHLSNKGYYTLVLCLNGKPKTWFVHRLVAMAFIPNPENKPHIDHISTITTDNRVENLRWATCSENHKNPISLEKHRVASLGEKAFCYGKFASLSPTAKKCEQLDPITHEVIAEYGSIRDAAAATHTCYQSISDCCRKIPHAITAGGFGWRFKE